MDEVGAESQHIWYAAKSSICFIQIAHNSADEVDHTEGVGSSTAGEGSKRAGKGGHECQLRDRGDA